MKKWIFIFFLFPLAVSAQLEFESYKGKLNFVELPVVPNVFDSPVSILQSKANTSSSRFSNFQLNRQNFREPVNMMEAMIASESYQDSSIELSINPREYGVYGGNSSYSADGATRVKNTAYKDAARGFFVADHCPPFGLCPRCAPYRIGSGRRF